MVNFGFRVCRMCLSPDTIVKMQSLFEQDQRKAEKFKFCFGVDVRFDQVFDFRCLNLSLWYENVRFKLNELNLQISEDHANMKATLVCVKCLEVLDECLALKEKMQESDRQHFNSMGLHQAESSEKAKQGSKTNHNSDENAGKNSGAKPRPFQCNRCLKFFTSAQTLKRHNEIHLGKLFSIKYLSFALIYFLLNLLKTFDRPLLAIAEKLSREREIFMLIIEWSTQIT